MKKIQIMILILLVMILGLLYFIVKSNETNGSDIKYIFIGHKIVFQYDKGWDVFTTNKLENKIINNVNVYDYTNNFKPYDLIFKNNSWNYIDDNQEKKCENEMFGITNNFNLSIANEIRKSKISSDEFLTIINKLNIKDINYKELNLNQKYKFDFDNDGVEEILVSISNVFSDISKNKQTFLIYIDENNYNLIENYNVTDQTLLNTGQLMIFNVLKNNNDYFLIAAYNYFSRPDDSIYTIYKFKNSNLVKIISN